MRTLITNGTKPSHMNIQITQCDGSCNYKSKRKSGY